MLIFGMLGVLVLCLLSGVPVSFSVGISAASFLFFQGFPPLAIIAQKMVEGVDSFSLMALPLFMLSGELMAHGCTPRLMRLAKLLVGWIPGGLGATAAIGCSFFGAISGSAVATTAAVGGIMAPEMVKEKYSPGFTASLIAGAGVLGMVIPPSFSMVVYGASANVSIGGLFLGGFFPGFLAVGALCVYSVLLGAKRGYVLVLEKKYTVAEKRKIWFDALLPLMMPVIILGGVLTGVFTPTESAVVAAMYAFILGKFIYKEINLKNFIETCVRSSISTGIIMLIMAFAAPFGWIMALQNVPKLFADAMLSVTSTPYLIFFIVTLLLLALGTFMEGTSIIILLTPILLPIVVCMGMDPIHFGIIMMFSMAIGGVTPPLAVSLFVSTRILGIRVEDTFPEVLYVVGILVFVLFVVVLVPEITMFLPGAFR